jgi:HPt (histidine-containing phosphotransfer) domain-containing protein
MEVTGQEARFRAMFAEEAEGRLATLSELLLELERNGDDRELLSSVFREAHTLKGAAAVVGLADVLRVAHAMEEVLEGLRTGDDRGDHADRLVAALHAPRPTRNPRPTPARRRPPSPPPCRRPPTPPRRPGRWRRARGGGGRPSACPWSGWTTWSGWSARRPRPPGGSGAWSPTSSGSSRPASPSWET